MNKAYLMILDGCGLGPVGPGNAVWQANTPYLHSVLKGEKASLAQLKTYGACVGLPEFQTGGSEVGHITIGAGRAVKHLLTKINDQIDDGSFFENETLKNLFTKAESGTKRVHFLGLTSDGGVHSFLPHLFGLYKMAQQYEVETFTHCFLDGRDVGGRTAKGYLEQIEAQGGQIDSMIGRFYSMDRDNNWERTQAAYDLLTNKEYQENTNTWQEVLKKHYSSTTETDYYLPGHLFSQNAQIQKGDVVIFWNYRTDRARQLSAALCDSPWPSPCEGGAGGGFERKVIIKPDSYGAFGNFYETAQQPFNFGKEATTGTLGELVSKAGGTQLRLAETEKFNHVTFFFSGETKTAFEGEDRILIPSPKVPNYAEKPEMSAHEVTESAITALAEKDYNLIIHNFANPDLVGHSGSLEAVIQTMEVMETCVQRIIPLALEKGYDLIITADHGNADEMILPSGEPSASHTKANAPFVILSADKEYQLRETGDLRDIAPTVCELLGIDPSQKMTGKSLIQ